MDIAEHYQQIDQLMMAYMESLRKAMEDCEIHEEKHKEHLDKAAHIAKSISDKISQMVDEELNASTINHAIETVRIVKQSSETTDRTLTKMSRLHRDYCEHMKSKNIQLPIRFAFFHDASNLERYTRRIRLDILDVGRKINKYEEENEPKNKCTIC